MYFVYLRLLYFDYLELLHPQFYEILVHFCLYINKFRLDTRNLLFNGGNVDVGFFLKCIDITRNVEVEVVFAYFVKCRLVAVFVDNRSIAVDGDYFFNVLLAEDILVLALLVVALP
jgi:hypothetical protein